MRRMMTSILAVFIACVCAAASAQAGGFAGANYGLTFFSSSNGGGNLTTIAAPGTAPLGTPTSVPGLRLGERTARGNEFHMDLGLMALTGEGTTFTTFQVTFNYQREFSPESKASPYINVGGGIFHTGFEGGGTNNPEFGAGFGFRNRIADGWGDVRFEARVDHYFEDSQGLQSSNAISLEMGFDLNFTKP